ncbi:MAG: hypothetical protein R3C05_23075 [Pirellulaceae bacterium]
MKKSNMVLTTIASLVAFIIVTAVVTMTSSDPVYAESEVKDSKNKVVPVEEDMHEFMEYYNEPTFKRLQDAMRKIENGGGDWGAIKSNGLILAEVGNLLQFRGQSSESQAWDKHAIAVRDAGEQLYQAAGKKDAKQSQQAFRSMIDNCNACHQQFAGGSPRLQP